MIRKLELSSGRIGSAKKGFDALLAAGTSQPKRMRDDGSVRSSDGVKKKHQLDSRCLVWYSNDDIHRDRAVLSTKSGDTAGSNNHYRFGSASDSPGELQMGWLSCPEACDACWELRYNDCPHASTTNYRSGKNRPYGEVSAVRINMSIKIPSHWNNAGAGDDEFKAEPAPAPAVINRRSRRRQHSHARQIKKGFTFCIRSTLQNRENNNGELWFASVVEYLKGQHLVSYNYYEQVEGNPGLWKLNTDDLFFCSVGEMLPPFGYGLTVYDDEDGTFTVSDRLAARFAATVADLR